MFTAVRVAENDHDTETIISWHMYIKSCNHTTLAIGGAEGCLRKSRIVGVELP